MGEILQLPPRNLVILQSKGKKNSKKGHILSTVLFLLKGPGLKILNLFTAPF